MWLLGRAATVTTGREAGQHQLESAERRRPQTTHSVPLRVAMGDYARWPGCAESRTPPPARCHGKARWAGSHRQDACPPAQATGWPVLRWETSAESARQREQENRHDRPQTRNAIWWEAAYAKSGYLSNVDHILREGMLGLEDIRHTDPNGRLVHGRQA